MILTELVDNAATRAGEQEALVGLNTRFTWTEVQEIVVKIGGALVADGVRPGDRVAVASPKDAQSFLAVHGALRAGAVVVPIDPMAPPAAAGAVIADAGASGIIGHVQTLGSFDSCGWAVPKMLMAWGDGAQKLCPTLEDVIGSVHPHDFPAMAPDDPAYIIYTSGSTGRPKGIVHTHRSACAYAERAVEAHELTHLDRVAGIPPLHFDQSTFELYAAPLAGAAVVVMSEAHLKFPASLTQRSAEESVSVWYSVPSLFRQVVDRGGLDQRDLDSLRLILYGGESYPPGALVELQTSIPQARITNVYGPAEVNECTNHVISGVSPTDADVPIGRAWDGVETLVVDDNGRPVPAGTPGELWISAPTMMQCYWGQPELTASAFRQHLDGSTWYASGDVAVCDEDGVLWFRGRRDSQIKIGGTRIELEAVELVVGDAPGVAEAVVGPVGDPARLEAAVVPSDRVPLDLAVVRAHCQRHLAQLAIPRVVHVWDSLPRTQSGKLDRSGVRAKLASLGDAGSVKSDDQTTSNRQALGAS